MNKFPLYVAVTLSFLGMIEVILRCFFIPNSFSWVDGLIEAAHDPGKTLFHVLVLPTAMYLLFGYLQDVNIKNAFSTPLKKRLNIFIICILALVPPIYTYYDVPDQFFSNSAMPWDFSDEDLAKQLMTERKKEQEKVRNKSKSGVKGGIENKGYVAILDKHFNQYGKQKTYKIYWKESSVRKNFSDFLSFIGVLGACFLLGSVALSAGIKNRIEAGFIDKLFLAYAVLATWIPMRMYSDWQGGLGDKTASNSGLIIAGIIVVILAGLFSTFNKPTLKVGITSAGIALVCTIIGAIGAFQSEWFVSFAKLIYTAPNFILFTIYISILVSFASLIVFAVDERS